MKIITCQYGITLILIEYITHFIANINVSPKLWEWLPQTFRVVLLTLMLLSPAQMILWKSSYGGRLWWSRGNVLAFGTQDCGFKQGRSCLIFQGKKILSMPSFGGEVKPSVPCYVDVGHFRQNLSAISRLHSSTFGY
jgi:hypothetical protein